MMARQERLAYGSAKTEGLRSGGREQAALFFPNRAAPRLSPHNESDLIPRRKLAPRPLSGDSPMTQVEAVSPIAPAHTLADLVREECGVDVNMCYQCRRCAAGCPLAYAMDYAPAQLIHAIRLGMDDLVFNSKTMWLCAACETCTTRCPQEVDISKVMDAAKILAVRKGVPPRVKDVRSFHKAVLANLRKFGRMYEVGLIMSLKFRTRQFFKDMALGMKMMRKGKMKLLPSFRGVRRLRRIMSRLEKREREKRGES